MRVEEGSCGNLPLRIKTGVDGRFAMIRTESFWHRSPNRSRARAQCSGQPASCLKRSCGMNKLQRTRSSRANRIGPRTGRASLGARERVLTSVFALAIATCAWSSGVPTGPLSDSEKLELGVSAADAVIVGTVVAFRDSILRTPDGEVIEQVLYLDLRSVRAIKGGPIGSEVSVAAPSYGPSAKAMQSVLERSSHRGMFFLRERAGWRLATNWAPGGGVLAITPPLEWELAETVRRIANEQSIEKVASRAQVIVLGGVSGRADCDVAGVRGPCLTVRVDSVIAGQVDSKVLLLRCAFPPLISFDQALFFMQPVSAHTYELVGFHAGVVPTTSRTTKQRLLDLPGLLRRVAESRSAARKDGQ